MIWMAIIFISLSVGWMIGIYHKLTQLRRQVIDAWSQIDIQLQKQHDLTCKVEDQKNIQDLEEKHLMIENKIAILKQTYQDNLTLYNSYLQQFPAKLYPFSKYK